MINYFNSRFTLLTEIGAPFLLWLVNWIFSGIYLPTLNVYYVSIKKEIAKRVLVPQLYYIKVKICYDPCFIDIAVVITT